MSSVLKYLCYLIFDIIIMGFVFCLAAKYVTIPLLFSIAMIVGLMTFLSFVLDLLTFIVLKKFSSDDDEDDE